jgi:hypothetical protein
MPRFALCLVLLGLLAILLTVAVVMGVVPLSGGLPLIAVVLLAGLGGAALVAGLWLLDPASRGQPFSG